MFSFIKNTLQKIYNAFSSPLATFFGKKQIDEASLKELELILIASDTGVKTTRMIIEQLKQQFSKNTIVDGQQMRFALQRILTDILQQPAPKDPQQEALIFFLVGINGSGKTTLASKLAYYLKNQNKKVLFIAADTFRAAAQEQLSQWAKRIDADIVLSQQGQDPAAVIFKGCEQFKSGTYDCMIIDTAGRLQTKINLMHELEKIKRVIHKQLPNHIIETLLTIDAMLGQNSLEQARLFKESTDVTGIALTKIDGTGKGGAIFAITHELAIPIKFITFGEKVDQLKKFDAQEFVESLLNM